MNLVEHSNPKPNPNPNSNPDPILLRNLTGHISESCETLYNNLLIRNGIRVSVKDNMALNYKFSFTFRKNIFY